MFFETKRYAISRAHNCNRLRAGLTLLEFVACTVAVIGGAWLGVLYLGIDTQHVAFAMLSQTKLLDKIPASYRPADPNENTVSHEQMLTMLHEEMGALRSQISGLHGNNSLNSTQAVEATNSKRASNDLTPTKERTRDYWQKLNEIASGERQLQREAESAFNNDNAAKVFAVKGRISRFSAKAIEAVPKQGVDESVIHFGQELALWYDRANQLYEKAVRIWETPMGQQARAQLNEEWKRSDDQHLSEGRLLAEKASAVRGSMSRIYDTQFPVFDTPPKPVGRIESTGKSG